MTFQQVGNVANKIVDRWAWWRAALVNPASIGKSLPVHENEAQQGYYRTRRKNAPWEPVAIYYAEDGDELVAYRNGREVMPGDVWTWCCRSPVSYEAYMQAMEGKGWPDDDPTVAGQIAPPPGIGDNSGDIDEAEQIRDQIAAAKAGADAYHKIADDETLAKAQSLRARLNELAKDADKKRDALKRPHLEAGKAIDGEWQPIIKDAKSAADAIRAAMSAYETEKLRKQREAERLAEEARRKAEDEARATGATSEPEPAPEPVSAAPAPIKGTYGKAASVKVRMVVTAVTDWPALATYMIDHPEMKDCLTKLAQRAVDAGRTVPGVTVQETADVR